MTPASAEDRARVDAAEAQLNRVSQATSGYSVEAIWLDEVERSDPRALPDALYVNRGDPYIPTLLFDTRRAVFLQTAWGNWLETEEQARTRAADPDGEPDGGEL